MQKRKLLFIDRDNTLIDEPPDMQVDSVLKFKLQPHVIPVLLKLKEAGYGFVMVTNQDGLGTSSFPHENFLLVQNLLLEIFQSQGIEFEAIHVCPHFEGDSCECRKPKLGLVKEYLQRKDVDFEQSYVIGDRETDMQLARNMGLKGIHYGRDNIFWPEIAEQVLFRTRYAKVKRKTNETNISVEINLDHTQQLSVNTGIGFFNHMLEQLAKHGGFSMVLDVAGDLHIDEHHTVEDTALALGQALKQALGDKLGIARYGFLLPMDESLAQIAIDLSGRPYFVFTGNFNRERVGDLPTELIPHFFRSLAESLGATVHVKVEGENTHHMIESIFKGVGRALRDAFNKKGTELPSTKGML